MLHWMCTKRTSVEIEQFSLCCKICQNFLQLFHLEEMNPVFSHYCHSGDTSIHASSSKLGFHIGCNCFLIYHHPWHIISMVHMHLFYILQLLWLSRMHSRYVSTCVEVQCFPWFDVDQRVNIDFSWHCTSDHVMGYTRVQACTREHLMNISGIQYEELQRGLLKTIYAITVWKSLKQSTGCINVQT